MTTQPLDQLLYAPLPVRFRLAHNFEPDRPEHAEAGRGIMVRETLLALEERLRSAYSSDAQIVSEIERARLEGLASGLAFYVRTSSQRREWTQGVALEVRDYLWRSGHPLSSDGEWEEALETLLQLAGHHPLPSPIQPGDVALRFRVRVPLTRLTNAPERAEHAVRLLQGLRLDGQEGVVEEVLDAGDRIVVRSPGGIETLTRESVFPAGDHNRRQKREEAIRFCTESLSAASDWGGPDSIDRNRFIAQMRERIKNNTGLWT